MPVQAVGVEEQGCQDRGKDAVKDLKRKVGAISVTLKAVGGRLGFPRLHHTDHTTLELDVVSNICIITISTYTRCCSHVARS